MDIEHDPYIADVVPVGIRVLGTTQVVAGELREFSDYLVLPRLVHERGRYRLPGAREGSHPCKFKGRS